MSTTSQIPLLKVKQWLKTWELSDWVQEDLPEPPHEFYIASVSLKTLRNLSGVSRRNIEDRRQGEKGAGYQRAHQSSRSKNIARYIKYGYPISNDPSLDPEEHKTLVHPGWLPTSILVNIIQPGETRRRGGKEVTLDKDHQLSIVEQGGFNSISIPEFFNSGGRVGGKSILEPIEIIDGQHRLFSIDELGNDIEDDEYEVPVVFFNGLSESWQAYLFWVINVEPKKINTSLAFDLYPELRSQSWLERGEGIKVYQEHRAQELTEVMWRHNLSPWKDRIELHGNRIEGHVSNAAFIRSLTVSFVRRWGKENKTGGFFGSIDRDGKERVLPWKRSQQGAYLIACWTHMHEAVKNSAAPWVRALKEESSGSQRSLDENEFAKNVAFSGSNTLMATDQGCRVIFIIFNAMSRVSFERLGLEEWESEEVSDKPEDEDVTAAFIEFERLKKANAFLKAIADTLVNSGLDWRTSSSKTLSEDQSKTQAAYRGSSGYSLLMKECFKYLVNSSDKVVADAALHASRLQGIA